MAPLAQPRGTGMLNARTSASLTTIDLVPRRSTSWREVHCCCWVMMPTNAYEAAVDVFDELSFAGIKGPKALEALGPWVLAARDTFSVSPPPSRVAVSLA